MSIRLRRLKKGASQRFQTREDLALKKKNVIVQKPPTKAQLAQFKDERKAAAKYPRPA